MGWYPYSPSSIVIPSSISALRAPLPVLDARSEPSLSVLRGLERWVSADDFGVRHHIHYHTPLIPEALKPLPP